MSLGAAEKRNARFHLEDGIDQLERDAAAGRYNTLSISAIGNAATLLGVADVAARATRLLRAAPDHVFFAGAMTNIELPQVVPDSMRELGRPEELARRHPISSDHDIRERIRSCAADEKHFALCLAGRVLEARLEAGSGRQLEEVGDALAILGDFDGALSVALDPALEEFRQQGVRYVMGLSTSGAAVQPKRTKYLRDVARQGLGPTHESTLRSRARVGNRGRVTLFPIGERSRPNKKVGADRRLEACDRI